METYFELWDVDSANLIADFSTRDEALTFANTGKNTGLNTLSG